MKKRIPFPHVSDHALLRYLERGKGMDIAAIRRHIADLVRRGVEEGANAVVVEGVKFTLQGSTVVTVLERHGATSNHRSGVIQ